MNIAGKSLSAFYDDDTISAILEAAINGKYRISFFNHLTEENQALTTVQLAGIKRFRGVNILLETGQTYQIGLELMQHPELHYQEVYFYDLIVDDLTMEKIKLDLKKHII